MRFLSKKDVKVRTLYSDSQRTRLEEAGTFPKRVRLGHGRYARVGYVETEIDAWCEARLLERDKPHDAPR